MKYWVLFVEIDLILWPCHQRHLSNYPQQCVQSDFSSKCCRSFTYFKQNQRISLKPGRSYCVALAHYFYRDHANTVIIMFYINIALRAIVYFATSCFCRIQTSSFLFSLSVHHKRAICSMLASLGCSLPCCFSLTAVLSWWGMKWKYLDTQTGAWDFLCLESITQAVIESDRGWELQHGVQLHPEFMPVIRLSQVPLCHTRHFSDKEMGEQELWRGEKKLCSACFIRNTEQTMTKWINFCSSAVNLIRCCENSL